MIEDADAKIESLKEVWLTDSDLSFLRALPASTLDRLVEEV